MGYQDLPFENLELRCRLMSSYIQYPNGTVKPLVMGILNITPDSFSDGGTFLTLPAQLAQVKCLVDGGADIIDVGGESSRPGAEPVTAEEELRRVLPVIAEMRKNFNVQISIDTTKIQVARAAVEAGATILNDISGAKDIEMAKLAAEKGLTLCLMHMQGTPQSMQENLAYPDGVVITVKKFLETRTRMVCEVGVKKENIWVDPGVGFGKTPQQNLDLLRHLDHFKTIGGRLLMGTSRKSFLTKVVRGVESIEDRESGTLSSNLWAYAKGASVFRVHDVKQFYRGIQTWDAIRFGIQG